MQRRGFIATLLAVPAALFGKKRAFEPLVCNNVKTGFAVTNVPYIPSPLPEGTRDVTGEIGIDCLPPSAYRRIPGYDNLWSFKINLDSFYTEYPKLLGRRAIPKK